MEVLHCGVHQNMSGVESVVNDKQLYTCLSTLRGSLFVSTTMGCIQWVLKLLFNLCCVYFKHLHWVFTYFTRWICIMMRFLLEPPQTGNVLCIGWAGKPQV